MLIYGDSDTTENQFFKDLKTTFNVNLLGNVHWYLGFQIRRMGSDYACFRSSEKQPATFMSCMSICSCVRWGRGLVLVHAGVMKGASPRARRCCEWAKVTQSLDVSGDLRASS